MAKTCKVCSKKLGIGKEKLPFLDKDHKRLFLCTDCYKDMPPDDKKKLEYIGEPIVKFRPEGLAFGVVGALGYSSGHVAGARLAILRRAKINTSV